MTGYKVTKSATFDVELVEWIAREARRRDQSFSSTVNDLMRERYERESNERETQPQ